MKRLAKIILSSVFIFLLIFAVGCQKAMVNEVVTIYNKTNHTIAVIAIAPEKDVINSEEMVVILDGDSAHSPMSADDYKIQIPEELIDSSWYIFVSGVKIENGSYTENDIATFESEVGKIFTDDTYGFQIEFDDIEKTFVLIPLSGV